MNNNLDKIDESVEKDDTKDIIEEELELNKNEKDVDIKDNDKNLSLGIKSEEYDIEPEIKSNDEYADEINSENGIDIVYSFNGEEVQEGMKIFQKETIYKRNMIYTGILAVLFFVYMYGIIGQSKNGLNMFLAIMCITVIGFIWYLPKNHIKKTAEATDSNNFEFTMTIYTNCINIGEQNTNLILAFNKEITKIFETNKLFLICSGKERMFILPKRYLNENNIETIKERFKNSMKENYLEV